MRKAGTMLPVAIGIIFMVCLIGINTEQKAEAAHFSDTVTVRVNFPALVVGMVKLTVTDLDSGHFQWIYRRCCYYYLMDKMSHKSKAAVCQDDFSRPLKRQLRLLTLLPFYCSKSR
jgi:hypothetical protein